MELALASALKATAVESWHAMLKPVTHRGECNYLEPSSPGTLFEVEGKDPGGPLFVLTTAGFNPGPQFDIARLMDFRIHVDKVNDWLKSANGRIASQVFTPHTVGDDGVTMSLWRGDTELTNSMYKPGVHRTQIDRYKTEHTADRTSCTRFRILQPSGQWGGTDPMKLDSCGAVRVLT